MDRTRQVLRRLRPWVLVGLAIFVAIQFVPFGRAHTNPPVTEQATWPSERAELVFDRSCAACHSHTTDWPWYSHVAPFSWLVTMDVEQGRDEMNVSTWDRDAGEADDAIETILEGTMPPRRYLLMHPSARLSDDDQRILVDALRLMDD